MKAIKLTLSALLLTVASYSAVAADVGVSIDIGDPNFYGQINIGKFPRPPVIYEQPVIIQQAPVMYEPIYLRVPPGHAKKWRRYCANYGACGRPVYFVQDGWYRDEYAPRYRSHKHEKHYHKHHDKHYDKHDRRKDRDDGGRGHGHGHGH
ncbi:hypothetical protein [Shewanella acanthi]|uniref:hypothetical protein n=1 Tax=Shewanella acanthi TaxID=2864212 RepID=UPI001C65AB79|nr:hypothetical protein [Shewanella acanthi]QYJ78150.1 hypothetical protein K0H61_13670 [Shewanella acanthi]